MKQKSFTVTSTQLNNGTEVVVDVSLTLTDPSGNTQKMFPQYLTVANDTGMTSVGILYTGGTDEETERAANPTNYVQSPLATALTVIKLPDTNFIVIKKITGTATSNLTLYCSFYKFSKTA